MGSDKRKYKRLKSVNLVDYVLKDQEGNEIKRGVSRSLDISQGGMRIEVDESIPISTKIELDVSIQGEINHFKGEVVHITPLKEGYSAGIRIIV